VGFLRVGLPLAASPFGLGSAWSLDGSTFVYCGDARGDVTGVFIAVDAFDGDFVDAVAEFLLDVEPVLRFRGRTIASCACADPFIGTRVMVGVLEREREWFVVVEPAFPAPLFFLFFSLRATSSQFACLELPQRGQPGLGW
jgi:hypothetical protein